MARSASTRSPVCSTKVNWASVRCILCSRSMLSSASAGVVSAVARPSTANFDAVLTLSSLVEIKSAQPSHQAWCHPFLVRGERRSMEAASFLHETIFRNFGKASWRGYYGKSWQGQPGEERLKSAREATHPGLEATLHHGS